MADVFYKLTNDEWVKSCQELTRSEQMVLFYLRTRSPFPGAQFDVTLSAIADELGIHKSSVSRAIKSLKQKKWIDAEPTAWSIRLLPHGVAPESILLHPRNTVAPTQQERSPRNDQPPEPKQGNDSDSSRSKIINIDQDPDLIKKPKLQNQVAKTKDWLVEQRAIAQQIKRERQEFDALPQEEQDRIWYERLINVPHSIRSRTAYYPNYQRHKAKLDGGGDRD